MSVASSSAVTTTSGLGMRRRRRRRLKRQQKEYHLLRYLLLLRCTVVATRNSYLRFVHATPRRTQNTTARILPKVFFLASSADACCVACQENPNCNVWTYCTDEAEGCGLNEYVSSYSQCTLKVLDQAIISASADTEIPGSRGEDITYTSGILLDKIVEPIARDTSDIKFPPCNAEKNANYIGDVIANVTIDLAMNAGACCAACLAKRRLRDLGILRFRRWLRRVLLSNVHFEDVSIGYRRRFFEITCRVRERA